MIEAVHPDWLEAFVAVADTESFASASRRLNRAQPTVHVQVRKLADHLGADLYRRVGRGIVLTAEGRRVAAFARETLARNRAFEAEVRGVFERRPVVLAAGEGAFLYLLGPAVRRFRRSTETDLRLLVSDGPQARRQVADGRADVAVTTSTPDTDFESRRLASSEPCVAMPRGHRLARRRAVSMGDLAGERWVAPAGGRPLRDHLDRAAHAAGFALDVGVEVHGWPLTLHFVALGVGVAVVNDVCRMPSGVVGRPLQGVQGIDYWAIRRRAASFSPPVDVLWAALQARPR